MSDSEFQDLFGDPIHIYTRAQALEDGILIDASAMAKQAGFKVPVALTHAVWEAYVEVPEGVIGQDVRGRLWDILFMAAFQARGISANCLLFSLHVRSDNRRPRPVQLKLMIGPGDEMEPVITILLPDED